MKLLFITRKVDLHDSHAGFIYAWVQALAKEVDKLQVISWQEGDSSGLPENVKVTHLKTQQSKFLKLIAYKRLVWRLSNDVDAVLCHQMPLYTILAAPLVRIRGKRIASWYVHKQVDLKLRLMVLLTHRIFTASKESFRLPSKKVVVTGHGIETDRFIPAEKGSHNDTVKLISISRISPSKKIELMIEAIAALKYATSQYHLEIIGSPGLPEQEEYLEKLKQLVKEKQLASHVSFLGAVAYQDIVPYLQQADIFLNMSETGSLDKAVLEAMSVGCLIITSNVAFRPLLTDKYFIAENDVSHLVTKIEDIAKMKQSERRFHGNSLRSIILQKHDLGKLAAKIVINISV